VIPLTMALQAAADEGALILVGPGAPDELPPAIPRRHVPPGVLLPLAEGARLADSKAPVVAVGGDGDLYGEGLGHLLHAVRRNTGVVCFAADNGMAMPGLAAVGAGEYALRPMALVLAAGATFAAQVTPDGALEGIAREALAHPGFALVNIRHERGRVDAVNLDGEEDYDPFSREAALQKAADLDHFYTGIFHRAPERAAFETVALGQSPLFTTVSTTEWDDWERIIFEEGGGGGDDDGPDDYGAGA